MVVEEAKRAVASPSCLLALDGAHLRSKQALMVSAGLASAALLHKSLHWEVA